MPLDSVGKSLILFGMVIVVVGVVMLFAGRVPGLGRLPGDIFWQGDNVSIYIPIATSIVASVILTILLNVIAFLFRRQ